MILLDIQSHVLHLPGC